jgi:protease I
MTDNKTGTTRPAGAGLTDEEAVAEVADQTASDLKAQDVFEREADGAVTEAPASDVSASELA